MSDIVVIDHQGRVVSPANIPGLKTQALAASTKGQAVRIPGLMCRGYNTGAGSPDWSNSCGLYRGPVLPPPRGYTKGDGGRNCGRETDLSFCTVDALPYQWVPLFQTIVIGATGLTEFVSGTAGVSADGIRLRTGSTTYGFLRGLVLEDSEAEIFVGKFRAPDVRQSYNAWDTTSAIVGDPENILRPASSWSWDRLWKGQAFTPAWVPSYNFGTQNSGRFVDIMCANTDGGATHELRGHALIDYRPPEEWPELKPENYPMATGDSSAGSYRVVQLGR